MQISLKFGKSLCLLSGFLFLMNTAGRAQYTNNPEYEQLQGGLVAGLNFSQVDGDGYKGYHKSGFSGGGILYLPFGNNVGLPFDATIALSMEVLYEQKGAHGSGAVGYTSVTAQDIRLHYAEVPIQINLFRGTNKSNFGMGLALGYLGFSEETITQGSHTQLKNALPFHKFDLSYVLTANIHVFHGLFISPRFEYSLISVRNNNSAEFGGRDQQFNNTVALRLMYLISQK